MPLHTHPAPAAKIPPSLKTRMPGESCFNVRVEAPAPFDRLGTLTREAAAVYAAPFSPTGRRRGWSARTFRHGAWRPTA